MKYIEEYSLGYDAGEGGEASSCNPHVYQCVAWYAWSAGWIAGHKDYEHDKEDDRGTKDSNSTGQAIHS